MRLLQPESLQLLGDSSDVGQILCLRVEESSGKKKVLILFTLKKKKKEKHWKLCHAQGERPEEGSFLAVAIPYAVFVCCYFYIINGEALISSWPSLWFWLTSSQGVC